MPLAHFGVITIIGSLFLDVPPATQAISHYTQISIESILMYTLIKGPFSDTYNRQQTTDNRQQTTNSRQKTAHNAQRITHNTQQIRWI